MSTNTTALSFAFTSSVNPVQAGGLISFNSSSILARFGVSFKSADQACANAEEEVPSWDWDTVQAASVEKWEDVLNRIEIDVENEDPTIAQLLYSSVRFIFHSSYFSNHWSLFSSTEHLSFQPI